MEALVWKKETLKFSSRELGVEVARSFDVGGLETVFEKRSASLNEKEALVFRFPPSIQVGPTLYTEDGKPYYDFREVECELWYFRDLGSFDSLRLAKEIFGAPSGQYFLEDPAPVEAVIEMLAQGFAEGSFRLFNINEAILSFKLVDPDARVSSDQYRLVDELNERFFVGPHMKARHASRPDAFAIGAVL